MKGTAEGPEEGRIFREADLFSGLHNRGSGTNQLPGPEEAFLTDVLMDGAALKRCIR